MSIDKLVNLSQICHYIVIRVTIEAFMTEGIKKICVV